MLRTSPIRIRLVLALLLILSLVIFASIFFVLDTLRTSMDAARLSIAETVVRLAVVYADLRYPGDWAVRNGTLYKGETLISGTQVIREGLAEYLPPEVELAYGLGAPPAPVQTEGLPFFARLFRGRLSGGADVRPGEGEPPSAGAPADPESAGDSPPPADLPIATADGAVLLLRGADRSVVGWVSATSSGDGTPGRASGFHPTVGFVVTAVAALIVVLFAAIIYRLSAPIDRIVEEHGKVTKRNVELAQASRTDPLSGLLNRRGFLEAIAEAAPTHQQGAGIFVALLDVDHFKHINDTYGHDCGDLVLAGLAELIRSSTRRQDYCVRWGGEEFLALLVGITAEQAQGSAERLRGSVERHPFLWHESPVPVTVTVGLTYVRDLASLDEAITRADQAMYRGKHEGRNRVVFSAPAPA